MAGITLAAILRVPPSGIADFQAYEDHVLPLLAEHGGTLERRLRNADGTVEVHILHFIAHEGYDAYRNDPRRRDAAPLMTASGAATEAFEVTDVDMGDMA